MRIAVGLPATIPGADGRLVVEWARLADSGPFSSLAALDRVLYDNYESMTALAAAAAVTERITLAATIAIAPLRSAAVLAKQAATVNALSGGRFVLGVGLGARRDDYDVTGTPYRGRGARLTDQIVEMLGIWEGDSIGPAFISRPRLLVGGGGGLGASRMARYADGFVHNGGPPRAFARAAAEALAAWEDMGRPGRPELWSMAYFELAGRIESGTAYLRDYYAFTGPFADKIAAGLLTTPKAIREFARDYEEAGCDELILFPTVAHMEELARLTDAVQDLG
jgi:alkanesulfonate monooxygenase SsuD/methylene tetrahydromethanopterin reductase-like flavin-dependent oxidoreductase (luciferase family)